MKKNKAEWSKPKLIVVTRGKKQESVLLACKATSHMGGGGGPVGVYAQCCTGPHGCDTSGCVDSSPS